MECAFKECCNFTFGDAVDIESRSSEALEREPKLGHVKNRNEQPI